jgi:hypothetical protein
VVQHAFKRTQLREEVSEGDGKRHGFVMRRTLGANTQILIARQAGDRQIEIRKHSKKHFHDD